MPDSSSRRCIHHGDTAVGSMPVTGRSPNRMHTGARLDRQRQRLAFGGQRWDVGGVDVVEVVGAGDFAGHAAYRQAVAAVRRDRQVEHHVVEPEHVGGRGAGFCGARRQHQDAGMVCAQVEFGRRADHSVGGAAVRLAGGDREITRQYRSGQGHARPGRQHAKLVAPQTMSRGSAFADVDLHRPDGLLELGEFLDLDDAADGQRPGDGPDRE